MMFSFVPRCKPSITRIWHRVLSENVFHRGGKLYNFPPVFHQPEKSGVSVSKSSAGYLRYNLAAGWLMVRLQLILLQPPRLMNNRWTFGNNVWYYDSGCS